MGGQSAVAAGSHSSPHTAYVAPSVLDAPELVVGGVDEEKAGSQQPFASPLPDPELEVMEEGGRQDGAKEGAEENVGQGGASSPDLILLESDDGSDGNLCGDDGGGKDLGDGRDGVNDGGREAAEMGKRSAAMQETGYGGSSGDLGAVPAAAVAASPCLWVSGSASAAAQRSAVSAAALIRAMISAELRPEGGQLLEPTMVALKQEEEGGGEGVMGRVLRSSCAPPASSSVAGGSRTTATAAAVGGSRKRKLASQRLPVPAAKAAKKAGWDDVCGGPLPDEAQGVPFDVDERGPDDFDDDDFPIEYIQSVRLKVWGMWVTEPDKGVCVQLGVQC